MNFQKKGRFTKYEPTYQKPVFTVLIVIPAYLTGADRIYLPVAGAVVLWYHETLADTLLLTITNTDHEP